MIRQMNGMQIRTDYWAKPGPSRRYDWTAVDYDTYAPASDAKSFIGYGETEDAAIEDLLSILAERDPPKTTA